jgi:putative transposase
VLNVVDAFTRECLALEVDTSFASRRVTRRLLDEAIARRSMPRAIRCDNGSELTSRHFLTWALEWKIEPRYIQPGRPMQNGHVESFHGRFREECLRVHWFKNLFDARMKIAGWKTEYSEVRPQGSLDYKTPSEFAKACQQCLNLQLISSSLTCEIWGHMKYGDIYGPVRHARAFFGGRSRIETRTYIRPVIERKGIPLWP